MYAYAHPIEDALENITHSICTLEFEDQRPFYDWVLERIVPLLRTPQFGGAPADRADRSRGVEAGKEFALHCHNLRRQARRQRYRGRDARDVRRWGRNPDAVLHDRRRSSRCSSTRRCFTPLLHMRWMRARRTPSCCRTSTSSPG